MFGWGKSTMAEKSTVESIDYKDQLVKYAQLALAQDNDISSFNDGDFVELKPEVFTFKIPVRIHEETSSTITSSTNSLSNRVFLAIRTLRLPVDNIQLGFSHSIIVAFEKKSNGTIEFLETDSRLFKKTSKTPPIKLVEFQNDSCIDPKTIILGSFVRFRKGVVYHSQNIGSYSSALNLHENFVVLEINDTMITIVGKATDKNCVPEILKVKYYELAKA